MFRVALAAIMSVLVVSAALAADYYPMKEGNSWTYSLPNGGEMTTKVTGFEEVKGVKCAVLETDVAGAGKTASYIATDADGIKMYRMKGPQADIEFGKPPIQIKLPFKQGDKWQAKLPLAQPIEAEMESAGKETLKVPAGTFECIRINSVTTIGENKLASSSWYADGVGMVQTTMSAGGQDVIIKLTKTNVEPKAAPVNVDIPKTIDPPKTIEVPAAQGVCPACGAKVAADAKFCTQCGAKIPPPPAVHPANCPKCGAKLQPDAKFCTECGAKIEISAPPSSPPTTLAATRQPIEVKQATPKELVETDLLAADRMDFDTLVRITAPDFRDAAKLFGSILTKVTQIHDRFLKLADAMEKPIGKEAAENARAQAKQMSPEDFKKMITKENMAVYQDGKIDWGKITIDEKGDTATATWAGKEHPTKMIKVDGKWYSVPGEDLGKTPAEVKGNIQKMIDGFDKGIVKLDDIIAKLNGGKMTPQEFTDAMQEFAKMMQEVK